MPKEHDTPRVKRPTILSTNRTLRNTHRPSGISRLISQGRNLARSVRNLASRPRNTLHRAFNHTRKLLSRATFRPFGRIQAPIPVSEPVLVPVPVIYYVFGSKIGSGSSKSAYHIDNKTSEQILPNDIFFRENQIIKPIPYFMVGILCEAKYTTLEKMNEEVALQTKLANAGLMPRVLTGIIKSYIKVKTKVLKQVGKRWVEIEVENDRPSEHHTYIVEECISLYDSILIMTYPELFTKTLASNISNYCSLFKNLINIGYIWIDCKLDNICDDGKKLLDAGPDYLFENVGQDKIDNTDVFVAMCILCFYEQLYEQYRIAYMHLPEHNEQIATISRYIVTEMLFPNFTGDESIHQTNESHLLTLSSGEIEQRLKILIGKIPIYAKNSANLEKMYIYIQQRMNGTHKHYDEEVLSRNTKTHIPYTIRWLDDDQFKKMDTQFVDLVTNTIMFPYMEYRKLTHSASASAHDHINFGTTKI